MKQAANKWIEGEKGNGTRPLNMYDVSIRVPLLITGPMLSRGVETDRCVDHFDTFRTICDLCGVRPEHDRPDVQYPGKNYLPLASGDPGDDWDDTRYGEYGDLRMVRTPHHKLVRRYPNGPDDLFDLKSDPGEKVNLIGHPEQAGVREDLLKKLDAFYARHEDPGKSGLRVKDLPRHNCPQKPPQTESSEAWRDGIRELRGLQVG